VLILCCCTRTPDINNLREGGFILAQFQRFQFIVLDSVVSGPTVRQNILVAGACGRDSSLHGGQEAEGERGLGKIQFPRTYLQQSTSFK
jgi:hypothetical protein